MAKQPHLSVTMLQLRGNQRLIFRSYVIIAFGVICLGLLLDWVLVNALGEDEQQEYQPWLVSTFSLIEARLLDTPIEGWEAEVEQLTRQLGMSVDILFSDDIAAGTSVAAAALGNNGIEVFYDADGARLFYKRLSQHDSIVSIGPVKQPGQRAITQWLRVLIPLLFYASIFVLVWIWIRPLIRDLDTLTAATETLQQDHRKSIPDFGQVTTIRPLADSFAAMTQRLSALIEGQREFTNALSHELRTPLARLKFGLEMLREDVPTTADNKLENLRRDVQEIDELIGAMLDYARLEHAELEIKWRRISARQLISETVNKLQPCASQATVEVANDVGSSEVECDPYLLGLALSNLLSNALRFANKRVHLHFILQHNRWCLQVDDDGPGVPEVSRELILKAFTRLDDSRDRDTGGYGLGLAIVNRIASLHGGSVVIEHSPLGGARFMLCWPVKHIAQQREI